MASINQDIVAIRRTIYGSYLQTIERLGLPFTLVPNTTLNERLAIQESILPPMGEIPSMRYLGIGNLGHLTVQADDGSDETIPLPHRPTDAGFFGQVPFVLREVGNDLTAEQRLNYRLRRIETHNGQQYVAYYLRAIDMTGVTPQLQTIEVIDGVMTVAPFTPTTDNLNPPRPEIPNTGVILGSNKSEMASAILNINLGPEDIREILNAHEIRTGSTRSPIISELGLVSGVDRDVLGSTGTGGSFTYQEVVCAQVNVFISTFHAIGYSSDGLRITLDVGGVEPTMAEGPNG